MTVHRNRPTGADEAGQMEVKTNVPQNTVKI